VPTTADPFVLMTHMGSSSSPESYSHDYKHEVTDYFPNVEKAREYVEYRISQGNKMSRGGLIPIKPSSDKMRHIIMISPDAATEIWDNYHKQSA